VVLAPSYCAPHSHDQTRQIFRFLSSCGAVTQHGKNKPQLKKKYTKQIVARMGARSPRQCEKKVDIKRLTFGDEGPGDWYRVPFKKFQENLSFFVSFLGGDSGDVLLTVLRYSFFSSPP